MIESLPPLQRLALAYAPASSREAMLALLALDTRLGGIVRSSREPMLAQLRLAWWREQLRADPTTWPGGEPLLAVLRAWPGNTAVLAGLVDGWEAMTGDAPLPPSAFETLAETRGIAFAALATGREAQDAALRMGRNWALADIAARLSDPDERQAALELARAQDWRSAPLPRSLRPLAVLHGLAARQIREADGRVMQLSGRHVVTAMRIGLLGR